MIRIINNKKIIEKFLKLDQNTIFLSYNVIE